MASTSYISLPPSLSTPVSLLERGGRMTGQWTLFATVAFALTSVPAIAQQTFDYVIVGGGTAGLVLANRLSENPAITVAVIEAGESALNNPNSTDPLKWPSLFGSEIDYAYKTTLQTGNKTIVADAGKALGGTSTINGMTYIRAEDVQIDAWEQLGNTGWNWKSMLPYYKKEEHFQTPTSAQRDAGASFVSSAHGRSGHVAVGWPNGTLQGHRSFTLMRDSWNNLGVKFNADPNTGRVAGFSTWPMTANVTTNTRADSARSYYFGSASKRANLKVFTKTIASKLTWDDNSYELRASGVVVKDAQGKTRTIAAKKEVIISAGSLRSPLFLEHSGVGNPRILTKYGIPVKLSLPSVGENLQDQPNTPLNANLSSTFVGYPTYVAFATAKDLYGTNVSAVERDLRSKIPAYARSIAASSNGALTPTSLSKILTLQADLLFKSGISMAELLMAPTANSFSVVYWLLLPFSRGSVHTMSADPFQPPAINPGFLSNEYDMTQSIAIAKEARKFLQTDPIAGIVTTETLPGRATVPQNAPDSAWAQYIVKSYGSNNHPIGTLSMMSKELGGVVDASLKVYGLQNVRVVDASVIPAQPCGHLTSTIYAIAERAADIIKQSQ